MRLNSESGVKYLKLFYLLCFFALVFDLVILNVDGSFGKLTKISPAALLLLGGIWYRGLANFVYDSDGEVLNITARDPNLSWISRRLFVQHMEFPKRKLAGYRISKLPFRRTLTLEIDSRNGTLKKEKFSISYLKRQELRDLERSLERVVSGKKNVNG